MSATKKILDLVGEPNAYANKMCDLIKTVVASYYQQPLEVFETKSRKREVIRVKQTSAYFMRQMLPKTTLFYIAQQMGYDHATIIHSVKMINNLLETDKETKVDICEISMKLQLKQDSMGIDVDIEQKYYYVNMDNCWSLKLPNGKDIVLSGFTREEVFEFIFSGSNREEIKTVEPVEHKNTGLFILKKKDA